MRLAGISSDAARDRLCSAPALPDESCCGRVAQQSQPFALKHHKRLLDKGFQAVESRLRTRGFRRQMVPARGVVTTCILIQVGRMSDPAEDPAEGLLMLLPVLVVLAGLGSVGGSG